MTITRILNTLLHLYNNAPLPLELTRLAHFVRVVDAGSFTAAAVSLSATKSTVSRYVADLEARLGVKLLARSTRSLSLTDAGRRLYEQSSVALAGMDVALREAAGTRATPRGILRIFAQPALGRFFLSGLYPALLRQMPDVALDLTYADRGVDVVGEGFDVAFVAGPVDTAGLVVASYGPIPRVLCAASSYLAKHGEPRTPEELTAHACIAWSARPDTKVVWRLTGPEGEANIAITPRVRANSADELRALMDAGVGIGCPPDLALASGFASKTLRRVLPEWSTDPLAFAMLAPRERRADPKVSTFLSIAQVHLSQCTPAAIRADPRVGRRRLGPSKK